MFRYSVRFRILRTKKFGTVSIITALNSNITNVSNASGTINVYVDNDGKLHFVNKDGADSVLNFSNGIKEIYIIKIQGNDVRGGNYIVDLYCIDSDKTVHNSTGYIGNIEGNYASIKNSGYSSGYRFTFKTKLSCNGTFNGSPVSYSANQSVEIYSWYSDLTQFIWILS
jgi:hypothetical protein